MSSGKTHLRAGCALWIVLGICFFWTNPLALLIGTLFPDTDHRKSLIGKIIPLWLIFKHRGFTHKLWGMVLFSGVVYYFFGKDAGYSFAIGYLLHLAMDSITPRGVKWI